MTELNAAELAMGALAATMGLSLLVAANRLQRNPSQARFRMRTPRAERLRALALICIGASLLAIAVRSGMAAGLSLLCLNCGVVFAAWSVITNRHWRCQGRVAALAWFAVGFLLLCCAGLSLVDSPALERTCVTASCGADFVGALAFAAPLSVAAIPVFAATIGIFRGGGQQPPE